MAKLAVTGEAVFVAGTASGPSVSNSGDLIYLAGSPNTPHELVTLDRSGRLLQRMNGGYETPRYPAFSHDGRRIALAGSTEGEIGIWTHDLERGSRALLAGGAGRRNAPA